MHDNALMPHNSAATTNGLIRCAVAALGVETVYSAANLRNMTLLGSRGRDVAEQRWLRASASRKEWNGGPRTGMRSAGPNMRSGTEPLDVGGRRRSTMARTPSDPRSSLSSEMEPRPAALTRCDDRGIVVEHQLRRNTA